MIMTKSMGSALERLDLGSLRTRCRMAAFGLGLVVSLAWIAAADSALASRHDAGEQARAEAITRSFATTLEGETLTSGTDVDVQHVKKSVVEIATANGLTGSLVVFALPRNADGSTAAGESLVPVASSKDEIVPPLPIEDETLAALLAGETTFVVDAQGAGVAVVHDAFGSVSGVVRLPAAPRTLLTHTLHLSVAALIAAALVWAFVRVTTKLVEGHCAALEFLACGDTESACGRFASREVRCVAETIQELSGIAPTSAEPATAGDAPREPAPAMPAPTAQQAERGAALRARKTVAPTGPSSKTSILPRRRVLGANTRPVAPAPERDFTESMTFDARLFVTECAKRFETRAERANLRLVANVGDAVPENLIGNPTVIMEALDVLILNAFRSTQSGTIQVRATRAGDTARVRFEVLDSGKGLGWDRQSRLKEEIDSYTSNADALLAENTSGLALAAALAVRLGGTLEFDSQPKSGSRFWFTAAFPASFPNAMPSAA